MWKSGRLAYLADSFIIHIIIWLQYLYNKETTAVALCRNNLGIFYKKSVIESNILYNDRFDHYRKVVVFVLLFRNIFLCSRKFNSNFLIVFIEFECLIKVLFYLEKVLYFISGFVCSIKSFNIDIFGCFRYIFNWDYRS